MRSGFLSCFSLVSYDSLWLICVFPLLNTEVSGLFHDKSIFFVFHCHVLNIDLSCMYYTFWINTQCTHTFSVKHLTHSVYSIWIIFPPLDLLYLFLCPNLDFHSSVSEENFAHQEQLDVIVIIFDYLPKWHNFVHFIFCNSVRNLVA